HKDEKSFDALIEVKNKYENFISYEIKAYMYQASEIFLITKVSQGEEKYSYPLFELFKDAFEKNIYITRDTIFPAKINPAIDAAVNVGELEWAKKFLSNIEDRLIKDNYEDYLELYRAKLLKASGRNEEAMELLNKLHTRNPLIKV